MAASREDVIAAATAHIESGHSTLWGQMFVVKGSGSETQEAAEWLAEQFLGVKEHMPKKPKSNGLARAGGRPSTNGQK